MQNAFYVYVMKIIAGSIIVGLFEWAQPSGNLKRISGMILNCVLVLIMIEPLFMIFKHN
ncbi:MAG: hypothetical protein IJP30_03000 [Clostridia bacterium]|nr:hypothetical protein [Clostridia bacterium]